MKNLSKTFGSIVLVALLIFSAVSCDSDPSTDNSNSSSAGGNLPATAIALTAGTWADGSLSFGEEQWFKFTATASTQYIHFKPDILSRVNVQLYYDNNNTIVPVGDQVQLYGIIRYISRAVTSGQTYYIKVTPLLSSGAYKIAFTASPLPPVTALTLNTWAGGSITNLDGEEWFSFIATAATQYIHFNGGTAYNGVNTQIYDNTLAQVGGLTSLTSNFSRTVTIGQTYYIRVTPYSTYTGTYEIGFTSTSTPPPISLPTTGITQLTVNTWTDGNIPIANGQQWFSFTATAATQYIHADFGTLTDLYVQVYDSSGVEVGGRTNLWSSSTTNTSRTLTAGQTYYIRVTPYSTYVGTYEIGFTSTSSPPPITGGLPTTGITQLTVDTWANGEITQDGEQWFTFTATADTQYIEFEPGTASSAYVRLYNSTGAAVGSRAAMGTFSTLSGTYYFSRAVTIGQTYYIRVTPYSTSVGTYTIRASLSASSFEIPDTGITVLTAGIWANGNITTAGGGQWFSFTTTEAYNYLHYRTDTLGTMYIQIYNADGSIRSRYSASSSGTWIGTTYTIGQTYYIRVWPTISTGSGTFRIGFSTSRDTPQSQ